MLWSQIDLENGFIDVDRAYSDNMLPKWDKIRGTPITGQCIKALKKLRLKSTWILPNQLVFCHIDGSPMKFTWWKDQFKNAMKRAGINPTERNLVPHSFRHSVATILEQEDYNPDKIRATMGWSSERTRKGYTHYNEMDHSRQREIIERELS